MTFTRMLDWLGGSPADATAAFEAFLDVEPTRPTVAQESMSKEEKRALLRQSLQAHGRDAAQTAAPT